MQDEFLKRIQMRKIKRERKENLESNFNYYLIMMIGTRKNTQTKSIVDSISWLVFFFFFLFLIFILR